eukprot:PLAT4440.5.p1 GENE.PLAT4440.5~~PLAT4440.5.p1  ORF type:complete len:412 (+),score=135.50 PLAT4440.5:38-1237(+)
MLAVVRSARASNLFLPLAAAAALLPLAAAAAGGHAATNTLPSCSVGGGAAGGCAAAQFSTSPSIEMAEDSAALTAARAIVMHETGDVDVLKLEDVELQPPQPGQLLLRVERTGVNFVDTYHRTGLYSVPLPFTPGGEAAGVVEAVGEDAASDFSVGDRVLYIGPGCYSTHVLADADRCSLLPDGVSAEDAVALGVQGITAHYLTQSTFPVAEGQTVLVHAGAGGTGGLIIQMAVAAGARVITTVGSEEKAAIVRELGASDVILYRTVDFAAEVRRLVPEGVHAVFDGVGKATAMASMDCLRPLGYLVLFGNASGAVPPIDPLELTKRGSLFLTRPTSRHYCSTPAALRKRTSDLFEWTLNGTLRVRVGATMPLASVGDAHKLLQSRKLLGKLVLDTTDA